MIIENTDFDAGKIAESGTHEQLLKKGGLYRRIYDMQFSLPDELKGEML